MFPSDLIPAAEADGDKDKALKKNDDIFGYARSIHSQDFKKIIILNITHLATNV